MTRTELVAYTNDIKTKLKTSALKEYGIIPGFVQAQCDVIDELLAVEEKSREVATRFFESFSIMTTPIGDLYINADGMRTLVDKLNIEMANNDFKNMMINSLTWLNIRIKDESGNLRKPEDIFNEISVKWNGEFH